MDIIKINVLIFLRPLELVRGEDVITMKMLEGPSNVYDDCYDLPKNSYSPVLNY